VLDQHRIREYSLLASYVMLYRYNMSTARRSGLTGSMRLLKRAASHMHRLQALTIVVLFFRDVIKSLPTTQLIAMSDESAFTGTP